jgi:hypothetical protein
MKIFIFQFMFIFWCLTGGTAKEGHVVYTQVGKKQKGIQLCGQTNILNEEVDI